MNLADLVSFGLDHAADPSAHRNFTLRKERVQYRTFCEAIRLIARVHRRGAEAGTAEGLLIVAQSGGGKSVVLCYYASLFPRVRDEMGQTVPVLLVTTPESPTVKAFVQAILAALGDPAFDKGTAEAKTQRLIALLRKCKVQLLLIDEFQHFFDGRRGSEARHITDWLKNLLNAAGIPVVLAGLPRSISVLSLNIQLRRRFSSPHYMRPFAITTEEDFTDFRKLLKNFHGLVPVACIKFHAVDVARRFFFASNGLIDYIVKIVDEAVSSYDAKSGEQLELRHLAAAFRSAVWSEVPDQLNPFCEGAALRPLIGPREPFENWDDPKRYLTKPRRTDKGAKK